MSSGIYVIFNKQSNMFYIGSSVDIVNRYKRHVRELKNGKHCNIKMLSDYNIGNEFELKIIEICDPDLLKQREQLWIDMSNARNIGYNMNGANGGDAISGHPNKDEIIKQRQRTLREFKDGLTREELSEKYGKFGEDNGMFGKTHTPETIEIIKDKIKTWYENNESPLKGVAKSEEHRRKLSEHAKTRTGDLNPFYGKSHSDETKKRLSESLKNRSPEVYHTRKVLADGIEYNSVKECAKANNISASLVLYRIKSKKYKYEYI